MSSLRVSPLLFESDFKCRHGSLPHVRRRSRELIRGVTQLRPERRSERRLADLRSWLSVPHERLRHFVKDMRTELIELRRTPLRIQG